MEPSVERPVTEVLAGKGQFQASKSQMQRVLFGDVQLKIPPLWTNSKQISRNWWQETYHTPNISPWIARSHDFACLQRKITITNNLILDGCNIALEMISSAKV